MKKIAMSIAAATMLVGGLAACGADNQQGMGANNYRQTGFESQDMSGAYTQSRYRGQGPVTDMMTPDYRGGGTYGQLDRQRTRTHLNNFQTNRTHRNRDGFGANQRTPGMGRTGLTGNNRPGMVDEDGLLRNRTRTNRQQFTGDRMGNGRITNQQTGIHRSNRATRNQYTQQNNVNYHKDYDSQTAQHVANRVQRINGVEDCRVIVDDNHIVVGVETNQNTNQVQQQVEQAVQKMAENKQVRVVTDEDRVNRIRTMDDRLRTGTAFDEVAATFTDMVNDLGRAVQRPFERSR